MALELGTIATNAHKVVKRSPSVRPGGLASLTETWLINEADMFGAIPAQGTANDDFAYLFFQEFNGQSIGNGLIKGTALYEGAIIEGVSTSTTPFYSMQTGVMQVPIEQHPSIATWVASERAAGRDPTKGGFFNAWKFGAVSSGVQSLYGVNSYEYPTLIWSKEWVTLTPPSSSALAEIGKIDTPSGSPPTPSDCNWLLIERSYRDISPTRIARVDRWRLSQANAGGGWNSDVY